MSYFSSFSETLSCFSYKELHVFILLGPINYAAGRACKQKSSTKGGSAPPPCQHEHSKTRGSCISLCHKWVIKLSIQLGEGARRHCYQQNTAASVCGQGHSPSVREETFLSSPRLTPPQVAVSLEIHYRVVPKSRKVQCPTFCETFGPLARMQMMPMGLSTQTQPRRINTARNQPFGQG